MFNVPDRVITENAIRSLLIFLLHHHQAQSSIIPISFHNNMSSHPRARDVAVTPTTNYIWCVLYTLCARSSTILSISLVFFADGFWFYLLLLLGSTTMMMMLLLLSKMCINYMQAIHKIQQPIQTEWLLNIAENIPSVLSIVRLYSSSWWWWYLWYHWCMHIWTRKISLFANAQISSCCVKMKNDFFTSIILCVFLFFFSLLQINLKL